MKQSFLDRLLTGLAGLILAFLGIGLFVYGVGIYPFELNLSFAEGTITFWQHVLMVAAALVLLLLGLRGMSRIFRSNREKGFILQRTEYGDLNISMNAMENMVKKCVDMNDELKVTQTKILHTRDGVTVSIRILLENGVNIPMIVSALQKQTKQYITSTSGIDVKEVKVFVDTSESTGKRQSGEKTSEVPVDLDAAEKAGRMVDRLNDAVQKAIQSDAPPQPEKEKKEPLHQRIFRKREEEPIETETAETGEPRTEEPAQEGKTKAAKEAKKKADIAGDPHDEEDAQ
jgi:uncharacterized alkaline shock family protein YloU